jgi:ammonium transporter, Amt family
LGYQLAGSTAGFLWSFCLTCVLLFLMNLIPGLSLRVDANDEDLGLDDAQLGEFAYDYVELTRHATDITPEDQVIAMEVQSSAGSGEKGARESV